MQEFRQPQLAVSAKMVAMTFGAGNNVYFSASTDRGSTFSKPMKVSESGKLSLGRHRGPRVAITDSAIVISAIAGEKGGGADGDLIAWRSTDGGRTWSQGVKVNDVAGSAREGLHAMSSGGGVLFATWLDLRSKGTKLYGASSDNGGATWSKNVLVYESPEGTICQCCHPSLLVDSKGTIHAMFRNALDGSRDMYVARSTDGGRTFGAGEKQGAGTWLLNACPMDGGGLAMAPQGKVVTVWRRDKEVFLSREGGREVSLGAGKDPSIVAGKDGIYAAWSSGLGLLASIPGGNDPVSLASEGTFVQLAGVPGGPVIAAWEAKGSITVRALP
ncbi:MAG: exo-alpha-sialidase [Bryobacterales bacterium]|nr:exo-alpha-sialidase [Bryobacterales bacterium]